MLVRCLKLEICLEVHLGSLLELVSGDESIHVQTITFGGFTLLTTHAHIRFFVEVFEFEFLLLDECAIVECARELPLSRIGILAHVLTN